MLCSLVVLCLLKTSLPVYNSLIFSDALIAHSSNFILGKAMYSCNRHGCEYFFVTKAIFYCSIFYCSGEIHREQFLYLCHMCLFILFAWFLTVNLLILTPMHNTPMLVAPKNQVTLFAIEIFYYAFLFHMASTSKLLLAT